MLKGLPASGKSTYAKEIVMGGGNWVRANKDLIRTMLHFDKWSGRNEAVTAEQEWWTVKHWLNHGKNVVIDDTNLGQSHLDRWSNLAKECNATFEVKNFDTSLGECLIRDLQRDKKVGSAVIMNMAMQYNLFPDIEDIVVCDIDGTVADCSHRQHHVRGDKKDWKAFFGDMEYDKPRRDIYNQVSELAGKKGAAIIFVSARPETYRGVTERWLGQRGMMFTHLIMRGAHDKRPDTEVKQNILDKYLKHYNIIKVFDDRPSVIRMWKENGLDVEDVGNGEEF